MRFVFDYFFFLERAESFEEGLQFTYTVDECDFLETSVVYSNGTVPDEVCMEFKWFDHGRHPYYYHQSQEKRW